MLTYETLKTSPRRFVSFSSLAPEEFNLLLPAFERAYLKKYPASKTRTGKARVRQAGAGRKGALAHHQLAAIHPFIDDNGRTGRLVMNLILFRHGYPPAVILRVNRKQYYQVLAQADAEKPASLVNFVGRAVDHSLTLYLEACMPKTKRPSSNEQWIPLSQAAEGTSYTQEYLSLLARQGRIEAIKRGRNWYTTRKAVKEYLESVK